MHRPRKRFGQNFLKNTRVIERIVNAINPGLDDLMVEIGPGKGALTGPLLKHLSTLHAIEIDADLISLLRQRYPNLCLHHADILEFSVISLLRPPPDQGLLRIVGNLPYNITTPLLFHLFKQMPHIRDMHFMVQREIAQRLAASCHTKAYGRLSVMAQYHCTISHLFDVAPQDFSPIPKVWSSLIRLTPHPADHYPPVSYAHLFKIVGAAFQQRRKMIGNCLKNHIKATSLQDIGINLQARPEDLSINDFIKIAQKVAILEK